MAELYRTKDVAEMFRVSKRTIERWIEKGELKTTPLPGNMVRISSDDIQEMMMKNKEKTGEHLEKESE